MQTLASSVYTITTPSGKSYVGVTCDPNRRFKEHLRKARAGSPLAVHRALRKYEGECVFRILFTERGDNAKNLVLDAEELLITIGGFALNEAPGGHRSPTERPEVAAKVSESTKKRMSLPAARAKVSAESRQRWADPAYRAKMAAQVKQPICEGARLRMSAAQKARFAAGTGLESLKMAHAAQAVPVICIETGRRFDALRQAPDWLVEMGHEKADIAAIGRSAKGVVKRAYGFTWAYAQLQPNTPKKAKHEI